MVSLIFTLNHLSIALSNWILWQLGVEQSYYTADFNNDHHVAITSLGPGIPMSAIYKWSYENSKDNLNFLD